MCFCDTSMFITVPRFIVSTEEVGHQKLAAQLIFRELSKADEPNLLDEEGDLFLYSFYLSF